MKKEEWITIKGFEDYKVSNFGNVKSFKRSVNGYILKPNKRGSYYSVYLIGADGAKNVSVHRLVATSFIPNPNNLPSINHINGDKLDNNVDNLEWCTYSQNTRHYYYVLLEGKLLRNKPVMQYSRTGKFIQRWDSIIDASNATGIDIDNIIHSCKRRHKRNTTKGFLWRFVGDDDVRLNYKNHRRVVHINRYGEKIGEYFSINEAAVATSTNELAIQRVCSNITWQTTNGDIWRYYEHYNAEEFGYYSDKTFIKMNPSHILVCKYKGVHDLVDKGGVKLVNIVRHLKGMQDSVDGYIWCIEEEGDKSRPEKRRKGVVCLDKKNNYICEYETISAAAKAMNCQPIHISIACRDAKKSCRGFRWMYKHDYIKT